MSTTHLKTITRRLADQSGITYSEALRRVRAANDAGVLPSRLAGPGLDAALAVLGHFGPTLTIGTRAVASRTIPTGPDAVVRIGGPAGVDVTPRDLAEHSLVLGTPSSAAPDVTVDLIRGMIGLGWAGTVIDASGLLADRCADAAAGGPYRELHAGRSGHFDPLDGLDAQAAGDLMSYLLRRADIGDNVLAAMADAALGELIDLMYAAWAINPGSRAPTLSEVVRILTSSSVTKETRRFAAAVAAHASVDRHQFSRLAMPSGDDIRAMATCGAALRPVLRACGGLRPSVLTAGDEDERFELGAPGLTYTDISHVGFSTTAAQLAAALSAGVLHRGLTHPAKRFVVVTSAELVDRDVILDLTRRARRSNVAVVLAATGPTALGPVWPAVAQNPAVAVICQQGTWEDGKACSKAIGPLDANDARQVPEHVGIGEASPDALRRLGPSEAIVTVGSPTRAHSWVSGT